MNSGQAARAANPAEQGAEPIDGLTGHGNGCRPSRSRHGISVKLSSRAKNALLRTLSALTRRHAVLLPADARVEEEIFDLDAPYRAEPPVLNIGLRERGQGKLTAAILAYDGSFPRRSLWKGTAQAYSGPITFSLDLDSGSVRLG